MSEINWKSKYEALKAKYLNDMDMAFRLGHEQGQQEAAMDSIAQQQQQQADEMAAQTGMQGEGQGQGDDDNTNPNAGPEIDGQDSAHPAGSELDQHINELEGMLGKNEVDLGTLAKSIKGFRALQSKIQLANDLKKSAKAIPAIAKALHKPKFKISQNANANLSNSAKKAVGMQQQIVEDVMKSWDEEAKKTGGDILSQLKVEGILKDKKE